MASSVAKELAIIIAGKDAGATGALKATKTEIEGVQNAAKAPGLAKMDADFRKLRESLVDPVKLKAIQTEMTRISAEAAKGPDAAKMKQLRTEVDKLETSYKQATSSGSDKFRGGLTNVAQAISPVQLGVAGLAVGLVAGAKNAVDSGISWETAFAGVRKTVDATAEELAQFSAGIRKMATEIPASREEIAKVAEAAGQLGVKKEALLGFTRTLVDLGNATNMSSEQAADSLARLANITGMPQENFDRLGSTVVALGNTMAATESEIVSMGLRLAGAGEQVGLTEDQILAFAAALSSVGIEAEMGGSAFSRVMIDMSNAAQKGGEDLEKFAAVAGMSAEDFAKKFREDAAGALVAFLQGLGKVKDEGGNVFAVLEDLGLSEIRVRDTVLRASSAHELFSTALKTGSKAWEENTALTKEAEERYKTTASKIEVVKNKFSEFGVAIFEKVQPAVNSFLDTLGGMLTKLNELASSSWEFDVSLQGVHVTARKANDAVNEHNQLLQALHRWMGASADSGYALVDAMMAARDAGVEHASALRTLWGLLDNATVSAYAFSDALGTIPGAASSAGAAMKATWRQFEQEGIVSNDAVTAATINSYMWQQDAAEVYNDYEQEAYKNSQDAAKKTANEAISEAKRAANAAISEGKRAANEAVREAEKIAEKVQDTLWDIGALSKKMVQEVGAALAKETDLWEEYGQRWIEQWGDVNDAIQQTYADRDKALADIAESEAITKDRDDRRKELNDRIGGEKKVFDLQMDDTEFHHREELAKAKALRDYQQALGKASNGEERNAAWEIYRQRLDDLVQEHQAFDAEVQWRLGQEQIRAAQEAIWANQQAALEKTLHEEELARQRDAIDARQQAEEARINAEWATWQETETAKTSKAAEEAKARARANLEAWRDEFIDKLEKEGAPGIERFFGMVAGKWADALARMGAEAASAAASSTEEPSASAPNEGTTSPLPIISSGPATSTTTPAEGWPPSFAAGGIVPGPIGAPVRAVVHGGETVLPAGRGGTVVFNLNGNYVGFDRSSLEQLARQLKPYLDSLVRL